MCLLWSWLEGLCSLQNNLFPFPFHSVSASAVAGALIVSQMPSDDLPKDKTSIIPYGAEVAKQFRSWDTFQVLW